MGTTGEPRFRGIDFEHSFLLGVIYDDESLTLEMEFNLSDLHPEYTPPEDGEEGCFRGGFIRFSDIEDLKIDKARPDADRPADYSVIYAVTGEGRDYEFSCGWGEIRVSARSMRIAFD